MITTALIRSEFARLTATPLARLAFIALMVVPLLYGGAYLWANQDPYAKLDQIPAAIVNNDAGATNDDGDHVDYGSDVTENAIDGGDFDWSDTSSADASNGVRSGKYDFVVTIPSGFSKALVSASSDDPSQARIIMTTADTNSYLASTIAEQAGKSLRTAVAQRVGKQAAKTLLVGLSDIRGQLGDAVDGADQLADGSASAESGAATLKDGTSELRSGAAQLADGTKSLPAQSTKLNDGAQQVASGADSLAAGLSTLQSKTADLPAQTAKLNDGAQQVSAGLATIDSKTTTLPAQTAKLNAGAQQLAAGLQTLQTSTAALPEQTSTLNDGAQQVAAGNAALAKQLPAVIATSPVLTAEQKTELVTQLNALATGSAAVASGTQDLAEQTPALTSGVSDAAGGSAQVAAGTKTLAESTPALASGIHTAAAGSAQVAVGTKTLADNTPALATGIATAASGASTLADGASQVTAGTKTLADSAPTLSAGAAALATGSAKVDDGTSSLQTGLGKLTSGAQKLSSSLAKGQQQIPDSSASTRAKQASVISNPVKVSDNNVASAGTYGAGLAPFFISLAAWIGMYALFLILKPISKRAITALRGPVRTTLGGWLTPTLLGVLQMAALFLIVRFALGFDVVHVPGTIAVMMLASATFAAILMALNVMLGSVGQFLGLVLMLIQLVTAGGTFPWQTLPAPLAALHHALPMSYSVDALRQLMYGGSLNTAWADAGVLACWLGASLVVTVAIAARQSRTRTLRDLRPSLIG
ncbi:YhgE/Pip family protein [Curtobacterium flaccumfaciens]|uniref:YhgE/Pip family protein n=1 Tax=Curtobacterium flaccumfaciens TaxID=2035 RepID=UPI003879E3A1